MDADEVLRVQDAVLILPRATRRQQRYMTPEKSSGAPPIPRWAPVGKFILQAGHGGRRRAAHTWPAVSTISVAYSWPRYLISLLNVFSMVG